MLQASSPQQKKVCIDYALANPEISSAKLATDSEVDHSTLCALYGWVRKPSNTPLKVIDAKQHALVWVSCRPK